MTAAVIPCCCSSEISDALRRIENLVADALYEAECLRAGAAEGAALPWQVLRALDLRGEALSLAGILGAVPAAAATASVNPEKQEAA